MASNQNNYVTVILGDEYDDQLRAKLLTALRSLGAVPNNPSSKALAGSQEIEEFDVTIDGQLVHVEAETYVGLSISGSEGIVNRIRELVAA